MPNAPLVTQEELPLGYDVPSGNGGIQKIYMDPETKAYPEVLRRYACEAWRHLNRNSRRTAKMCGINPTILRKWLELYLPEELSQKRNEDVDIQMNLDKLERRLEKSIDKALKLANRQMKGASYSQLMVGAGIMFDKLVAIKKMPRPQEKNVAIETLNDLPEDVLLQIWKLIEGARSGKAIEDSPQVSHVDGFHPTQESESQAPTEESGPDHQDADFRVLGNEPPNLDGIRFD